MFYFENDYCEGAHPAILQKLMETNFEKVSGYGTDPYCASAREKIRAACACPEADVTFISVCQLRILHLLCDGNLVSLLHQTA